MRDRRAERLLGQLPNAPTTLSRYHKQKADCDGKCDITHDMTRGNPYLMQCVTCPFCKETVNAILTDTSIKCPVCGIKVNRY